MIVYNIDQKLIHSILRIFCVDLGTVQIERTMWITSFWYKGLKLDKEVLKSKPEIIPDCNSFTFKIPIQIAHSSHRSSMVLEIGSISILPLLRNLAAIRKLTPSYRCFIFILIVPSRTIDSIRLKQNIVWFVIIIRVKLRLMDINLSHSAN